MTQQLWRLDDETKTAVLNHKREQRYIAELKQDLADYHELLTAPIDGGQRSWVDQMIKSVQHELDEIEAGRLTVPSFWRG